MAGSVSSLVRRTGPFAHRNPRLYVLFTLLYIARAYYPVLAIFFTDLGLTLERFVLLNLVWAAAIFLLEVPSGALADTIGRKRLLVIAAGIMVIEMGILLVAPKDGGWLLFALCILNRALSGASPPRRPLTPPGFVRGCRASCGGVAADDAPLPCAEPHPAGRARGPTCQDEPHLT